MRGQSHKLIALLASLVTLQLAACSTLTSGMTKASAIDAFKPIRISKRDTCETKKQVAEHNSRYDTIRNGKETVYKADCDHT